MSLNPVLDLQSVTYIHQVVSSNLSDFSSNLTQMAILHNHTKMVLLGFFLGSLMTSPSFLFLNISAEKSVRTGANAQIGTRLRLG